MSVIPAAIVRERTSTRSRTVAAPSADYEAKGLRLILLSFFFPLAIYLLLLGFINRRRHPLLVSGVWDGIGLIFGVSGFLLFAGPAILSSINERWRLFWLLGKGGVPLASGEGASQLWIFLSILYFVLVVGGVAFFFWRQRRLTAIFNADISQVERGLTDICEQLGINPVRSGDMFLFGLSSGVLVESGAGNSEALLTGKQMSIATADSGLEQPAILEVDSFPLMRHVTLRWDPVDSPLRRTMEANLSRHLSKSFSGESLLSGWLLTIGFVLLSFDLAGVFFLVLLVMFPR
jgi:hypothetical protein